MHPIEGKQDKFELEIDEEQDSRDKLLMNSSR
jgi:hypothetical protein